MNADFYEFVISDETVKADNKANNNNSSSNGLPALEPINN